MKVSEEESIQAIEIKRDIGQSSQVKDVKGKGKMDDE